MDNNYNQTNLQSAVSSMERLISQTKEKKSTSLKSLIAAMYTADESNILKFTGKIGMLQLDYDRGLKCHFFRFYNIETLELLLQIQLYYDFSQNYRKAQNKQTLYIFDYFSEGIMGFEFINKEEAELMEKIIKVKSQTMNDLKQLKKEKIEKQNVSIREGFLLNKIKNKINKFFVNEPRQQQSVIIQVKQESSIKINYQTGQLDLEHVSPALQQIFVQIGLKKQDLQNKQIAKVLIEQLLFHEVKKQIAENPSKATISQVNLVKTKQKYDDKETTTSQSPSAKKRSFPENKNKNLQNPPTQPINPDKNKQSPSRVDFLQEIRNNNIKLKSVKTTEKRVEINVEMNKAERKDLADHVRVMLKKRKLALNRRHSDDEDDQHKPTSTTY